MNGIWVIERTDISENRKIDLPFEGLFLYDGAMIEFIFEYNKNHDIIYKKNIRSYEIDGGIMYISPPSSQEILNFELANFDLKTHEISWKNGDSMKKYFRIYITNEDMNRFPFNVWQEDFEAINEAGGDLGGYFRE